MCYFCIKRVVFSVFYLVWLLPMQIEKTKGTCATALFFSAPFMNQSVHYKCVTNLLWHIFFQMNSKMVKSVRFGCMMWSWKKKIEISSSREGNDSATWWFEHHNKRFQSTFPRGERQQKHTNSNAFTIKLYIKLTKKQLKKYLLTHLFNRFGNYFGANPLTK
jgi:hypothetical protein